MFSKIAVTLVSLTALASALPVRLPTRSEHSLDSYGGHDSLQGFDDFYGGENFDSSHNERHEVVEQQHHLVCHSEQVTIIQQRLVVLQELAKKIITERICEVETQTVVLEQWRSSIRGFHYDVHRHEGRRPGYDSHIVSHYNDMFNDDGSFSDHDLGFHGSEVGSNYVYPDGSNWNDSTSPESVECAYNAANSALEGTSALPPVDDGSVPVDDSDASADASADAAPADDSAAAAPPTGDDDVAASSDGSSA